MARKKEPTEREVKHKEMLEWAEAALEANEDLNFSGGSNFGRRGHHPIGDGHALSTTTIHGGFQDHNQAQVRKHMRSADKAYREVGIVRNVIDIMTDFAAEGLNVHHPVPAQERFYRAWLKKVNMQVVAKQILQGMYKWGNIGVFKFWGKIRPKTRKEMMAKARRLFAEGKNKEALRAFFRKSIVKKSKIPVRYVPLAPFRIRIHGSVLFPDREYFYHFSQLDRMKFSEPEKHASPFELKLLKEMEPQRRVELSDSGFILLPDENFDMFHYKRDASRLWADPLILPIMQDLRYKQVLRRLDISVAESIINPITIFKLGKTVEGFAPTREMFQNLAALLKTPVATKTLVWSDLIEVEQHFVDAKEVFSSEKYAEVDGDILAGLGISQILINGGNAGTRGGGRVSGPAAFLSVRTLLERLEDGRNEVIRFLEKELRAVADAMSFRSIPKIAWDQMSLRDEAAEKRIMIELRDRKIISNESLLDFLSMDNEIEMSRKNREEKIAERLGIPQAVGPFEEAVRVQSDEDPARLNIDMQEKQLEVQKEDLAEKRQIMKEVPKNKDAPRAGPGRPNDRGDEESRRQKVKRDTKPAGASWTPTPALVEEASINRVVIENFLKPIYLNSLSKNNLRQLTIEEKNVYDSMVDTVLAHTNVDQKLTEEWIKNKATELATDLTNIKQTSMKIAGTLIKNFTKEHGKSPSSDKRKELVSRAWAISKEYLEKNDG
jgi:hypothetical protein